MPTSPAHYDYKKNYKHLKEHQESKAGKGSDVDMEGF